MTESNQNLNSLIPTISKGVVRVGKSIDVTKKLISQGSVLEKKYSKLYVIPFKKFDGWYLFDKNKKKFFNGPYRLVSRNKEFTLCLDFNNTYWLFKNDLIICHFRDFTHDKSLFEPSFAAAFKIIKNKYIALFYYEAVYGRKYIKSYCLRIQGVLDFEGNKIEYPLTENELQVIIDLESANDLKMSDTLWHINGTSLYYKNSIVIDIQPPSELIVRDFHCGYALVKEVGDIDPEFGELSIEIGYIDVYGNIYWDNKTEWRKKSTVLSLKKENEDIDETDLPF
jgi:hypothetical protein